MTTARTLTVVSSLNMVVLVVSCWLVHIVVLLAVPPVKACVIGLPTVGVQAA